MQTHTVAGRGWSISAIARHLGRDRKTVRAYLSGGRQLGVRRRPAPDPIEPFVAYLGVRFVYDPHLWLTAPTMAKGTINVPRVTRHPRPRRSGRAENGTW